MLNNANNIERCAVPLGGDRTLYREEEQVHGFAEGGEHGSDKGDIRQLHDGEYYIIISQYEWCFTGSGIDTLNI